MTQLATKMISGSRKDEMPRLGLTSAERLSPGTARTKTEELISNAVKEAARAAINLEPGNHYLVRINIVNLNSSAERLAVIREVEAQLSAELRSEVTVSLQSTRHVWYIRIDRSMDV